MLRAGLACATAFLLVAGAARAERVDPELRRAFATRSRQVVLVGLAARELDRPLPPSTSDLLFRLPEPFPLATLAPHAAAQVRILTGLRGVAGLPGVEPRLVRAYDRLPLLALDATESEVRALEATAGVDRLWASKVGRPLLASSLPFSQITAFQDRGFKGAGTAVAVADLAVRYWTGEFGTCPTDAWSDGTAGCALTAWKNFNLWPQAPDDEPENDPKTIATGQDHGTHVAAIVHGVAPDAKILGLNVFSLAPDGTYGAPAYDVLAALDWVAAHAAENKIVAVNLSVGWEHTDAAACDESPLFPAIRALWDQGVVLVAASGNDAAADWLNLPACTSLALSVGAQYDTELSATGGCEPSDPRVGEIACITNLSGALDFVAPGMHVEAAGVIKSGTSMAAPHVAGAVALVQSRWIAEQGGPKAPAWAREQLLMDAGSRPHDGRIFHQLSLAEGPRWSLAALFPSFARGVEAGTIPKSPGTLEQKVHFAGRGGKIASAYLHLELVDENPEHLKVTLLAPDGKEVALTLPAVGPHFNAVLGKDYSIAAYQALAGSPVDGDWRLRLEDSTDDRRGYYLTAALFLVAEGCQPQCPDKGCGDDRCGGTCGGCADTQRCSTNRACVDCTPDCGGRTCGPDRCGGRCGGCADKTWCNGLETCLGGACSAGAPRCWQVLDCGTLACDEASRSCLPTVTDAKSCLIDLACYADAAPDDSNPCHRCDAKKPTAWVDATGTCDDHDACTSGDACQAGKCAGVAKDCSTLAKPCWTAACDSLSGECVATALPDGTACDDGDGCTGGDACKAGACVPGKDRCGAVKGHVGCVAAGGATFPWAFVLLLGLGLRRRAYSSSSPK